jgi:hypothetical protein
MMTMNGSGKEKDPSSGPKKYSSGKKFSVVRTAHTLRDEGQTCR